jgi:nucleotide-binding universal stress UspA family protein
MALKDLLVYVDQTDGAPARLSLAADLAARHASRLTALYVREWSPAQQHDRGTAELGLISASDLKVFKQHIEASIDAAAERLHSSLEALGRARSLHTEWRCVDGSASVLVPQYARCADLCIVGPDPLGDRNSVEHTFSQQLLFVSGRPVLFIPGSVSFQTLGRHIVVAWDASRAAARAVNDALPLIEGAERTTLLTVSPADCIDREGALLAEQMVEHLRKHATSVDAVEIEVGPGSIADTLQAQAHALGADLIVAGAFGHPKLWEKLVGGVTRDLLARMSLPIFMSH